MGGQGKRFWNGGSNAANTAPHYRNYHNKRSGIGEIMAVGPDWSSLPSRAERLFLKLGKKEAGTIGPDLYRRDMGGMGANKVPVTYEPTLAFAFPRTGVVNPVNYEETMHAIDDFIRNERNASQPLGPVIPAPQSRVLDEDPYCGSARFDFHFTDLSSGFEDHNRRVFVREKSGVLRTARPAERTAANQAYFAGKDQKGHLPSIYEDYPSFKLALDQFSHAYLLDEICKIRQPTDEDYVRVHNWVYRNVAEQGVFQVLQGTPHFQGFARWIVAEDQIGRLVLPLAKEGRIADAGELVLTYCEERPNPPLAVAIEGQVQKKLAEQLPEPTALYAVGLAIPEAAVEKVTEASLLAAVQSMHVQADLSPAAIAGTTTREVSVVGSPSQVQAAVAALSALVGEEHVQMASEPASVPFAAFTLTSSSDRDEGWAGKEWEETELVVRAVLTVPNDACAELTANRSALLREITAGYRRGGPLIGSSVGAHWKSTGTVAWAGVDSVTGVWGAVITPVAGGDDVQLGMCAVADGVAPKIGATIEYIATVDTVSGTRSAVHAVRVGAPAAASAARSRGVMTRVSSQTVGTVFRWDADRGFGFIQPLDGGEAIYFNTAGVHSAGGAAQPLVVGEDVIFDKVLNEEKCREEARLVTSSKEEPVHGYFKPNQGTRVEIPFTASAMFDPTNGPAPTVGDSIEYKEAADGSSEVDHFILGKESGLFLNAEVRFDGSGSLNETSSSVHLTGHQSAVQRVADAVLRVVQADKLPRIYLEAYASCVSSTEIEQLLRKATSNNPKK